MPGRWSGAARVAWARLSWNSPRAALNTRRAAMMAASTYLPSASSSTIAASSIHGTGAQNFSIATRNGCSAVSGIALGPNFSSRRRASSLISPFCGPTSAALVDFAGVMLSADGGVVIPRLPSLVTSRISSRAFCDMCPCRRAKRLRRQIRQRPGFGRIKNPIGEQFHAVIHEEPS